jgi:hypothetical protein
MVVLSLACAAPEQPVGELAIDSQSVEMSYPQAVRVALTWTMRSPLEELVGTPRVFLHLVDASGEVVRTFDHDLPRPWSVGGETTYDVVLSESALVPALLDGQYALTAGIYDGAGHRWPLTVAGEEVRPLEYRIATVTASGSEITPQFFFSSEWLPVEGGTDLQILARRWLAEDGVLRLSEIPGEGTLYLRIGIPRESGSQELVMTDESSVPAVRISTTCGDYETDVSGSGSHVAEVPVSAEIEGNACDVSFSSNFHLLSRDNMSRRTLALEDLSWEVER